MANHRLAGKVTASLPSSMRGELNFDKLKLINKNSILFAWVDELEDTFTHQSGIVIVRTLSKKKDRWAVVLKVHESVIDVEPGDYILPLELWKKEPYGANWNGLEVWMTSSEQIAVVTKDKSITEVFEEK